MGARDMMTETSWGGWGTQDSHASGPSNPPSSRSAWAHRKVSGTPAVPSSCPFSPPFLEEKLQLSNTKYDFVLFKEVEIKRCRCK